MEAFNFLAKCSLNNSKNILMKF